MTDDEIENRLMIEPRFIYQMTRPLDKFRKLAAHLLYERQLDSTYNTAVWAYLHTYRAEYSKVGDASFILPLVWLVRPEDKIHMELWK